MIILVPFFGNTARFRPLLERWFESFNSVFEGVDKFNRNVVLLHEKGNEGAEIAAFDFKCGRHAVDLSLYSDVIREGQPFDVKGALVCGWLDGFQYPTLVLDVDATLAKDPSQLLSTLPGTCSMAMPDDHGAFMHWRSTNLNVPYQAVRKRCAGVQWFPAIGDRSALVEAYREAWHELNNVFPWTPAIPHLLEQYAWSLVHHRVGGAVLPNEMNWGPLYLGENPRAIVNHDYGLGKWGK